MRKTAPSADMPSVPVPPAPAPMPGSGVPSELLMRHPRTGEERIAPVGYAWSVLLAGPFVLARSRSRRERVRVVQGRRLHALGSMVLPLAPRIRQRSATAMPLIGTGPGSSRRP